MNNDMGYLVVAVIVLALAAALVPAANTEEAADCIENKVNVNGEEIVLKSESCQPSSQAATLCVESEVRVQGQDVHLSSSGCRTTQAGTEIAQTPTRVDGPTPDAPLCPTHNPRDYHVLWDEQRDCHYDHQHGDDPHAVDDIFGRDYYEWAGGEIAYPWQTPGENRDSHSAFGWLVRRDLPCGAPYADGCITDFRAQYHGAGAAQAAVVSYHSAWLEARVCLEQEPSRCGIVRVGGWQGPADLVVDDRRLLDREDSANRILRHYDDGAERHTGVWYTGSTSGVFNVVPGFEDMWNTVPPLDTAQAIVAQSEWFCAGERGQLITDDCTHNSSRIQAHAVGFQLPAHIIEQIDVGPEGFGHFQGYLNPLGEIDDNCDAPGPDCVPFAVRDVSVNIGYEYRGDAREYDICFADDGTVVDCDEGRPSGWLTFPIQQPSELGGRR